MKRPLFLIPLSFFIIAGIIFFFSRSPRDVIPPSSSSRGASLQPQAPELPQKTEGDTKKFIEDIGTQFERKGVGVQYTKDGFFPREISVRQDEKGEGCFVSISNEADDPLFVRLSPHTSRDNWGFQYPPIAPGVMGIIDPRYRGFQRVSFHNHKKPSDEFSVKLGEGCMLE